MQEASLFEFREASSKRFVGNMFQTSKLIRDAQTS